MKTRQRGFTLIELLVVIAIIGVLSAVVLASLNTARSKGSDAAIQADINGIRTQAQIYYTDNNNYGTNTVDESGCSAANTVFVDATVARQVQAADDANGVDGSVTCNVAANGTAYAVAAEFVTTPNTYYCIDSTGISTSTATALGANTACPS